jgi:hypothetical protein
MPDRRVIGLDFSTQGVRAVCAERRGRSVVPVDAVEVRLPRTPEEADRVFRGLIEKKGWAGLPCAVGLRGESVILRAVDLGGADERSPDDIMAEQMHGFMGLSRGETVSDFSVHPREDGGRRLLYAVAREEAVRQEFTGATAAGLRLEDALPAPIACYNAAAAFAARRGEALMCLEFRDEAAEVVAGRGPEVLLARRLLVGGGPGATDTWVRELEACVAFYRTQIPAAPPIQRVVLAGLSEPDEALRRRAEEIVGAPATWLGAELSAPAPGPGGRFATAAGLALGAAGAARVRLSLLPPRLREAIALRRQWPQWCAVAGAIVAALALVAFGSWRQLESRRAELGDLRERLSQQQSIERQIAAVLAAESSHRPDVLAWRGMAGNGARVLSVLQAVADARHSNDWIVLLADAATYLSPTGGVPAATNPPPAALRQFVVEGYTPTADLSTVKAMIGNLRENPRVATCDLLPDDKLRRSAERDARWEDAGGHLFALEIGVKAP